LGFCFDTCHGFAAGYDLRTPQTVAVLTEEISRTIGLKRLSLLHLNDGEGALGSHLDRHEHIGKGKIGIRGFKNLLHHPCFRGLPMILETPKGPDLAEDVENLRLLSSLMEGDESANNTNGRE